jgi:hypothetical protein
MLRKIAIGLATASLLGAAAIPTDAMARAGGHGGFGGGFHGGGFSRGFAGHGFAGHGFAGHGFAGRGFGPGWGYYGNACYGWTPFGYRWVCGYPYDY